MLRILGIVAVVALVASAVFASAAGLGVQGGTIQVGQDVTSMCPDVEVRSWRLETKDDTVSGVTLSGLAECKAALADKGMDGVLFVGVYDNPAAEGEYIARNNSEVKLSTVPASDELYVALDRLNGISVLTAQDIEAVKIWVHNKYTVAQ
jgi:hypothetical protein